MKGRNVWRLYSALVLACLIILPAGCSKKESPGEEISPAENAEPVQKEDIVFTRDQPGPWIGKEDDHVPRITATETDTGGQVVITVNHEMNAERPHFIMWIQLKDGKDNLLGEKTFNVSDEKAEAIFSLSALPDTLFAFSKCNLHGLWSDSIFLEIE